MHNGLRSGCRSDSDAGGPLCNHVKIQADASIGKLRFRLGFMAGGKRKVLTGAWVNQTGEDAGLSALEKEFSDTPVSFQAPPIIADYGLTVKRLQFGYAFEENEFSVKLVTKEYGTLTVSTGKQEEKRTFSFVLGLNLAFPFQNMPLIGQCFQEHPIRVDVKELGAHIDGKGKCTLSAAFSVLLEGQSMEFRLPDTGGEQQKQSRGQTWGPLPEQTRSQYIGQTQGKMREPAYSVKGGYGLAVRDSAPEQGDIKWVDIKKNLGPVQLSRFGFALSDGSLAVYVDAGLKLSVLLFEVIGLYVMVPMKKGISLRYGIQGMTVNIKKEPFSISGGLYVTREKETELYTGELSVQIKNFQLTALASYGKMDGAESSFFAFLLMQYPLGGPPAFYIQGIAGGFGYNRTIELPSDVKKVREFPFVAAALGMGGFNKSMTPADVLKAMNTYILPKQGQFFASAGIRFSSFGILDSFLLLNVLFGKKFEISLLGISALALPPKQENPFIFIELLLKAVIAPADGEISILGALSSRSYLLHPDCKLTGGFAFAAWFGSNEHTGDFVLTLGGYKEGFEVAHYPKTDRIGINWKISNDLKLSAAFYFALTPSCIMMGGNASLTFEKGRIKAWFCAHLEFYMKWQPFAYEFSVGVSLGASYRWDFFPFYKTFKVELSADLSCYGPPFGGKVHVSWFVISFTISFGEKKAQDKAIPWDEFADSFLVKQANGGRKLIAVRISGQSAGDEEKETIYYSADDMLLEVDSLLPCTSIVCHGADNGNSLMQKNTEAIGVVPMQIESYTSELTVSLKNSAGEPVKMKTEWIYTNVPKALWNTRLPNPYDSDGLKKNQLTGVRFRVPEPEYAGIIPENGTYSMAVLCERERLLLPDVEWPDLEPVEPVDYPGDAIAWIEKTIVHCKKRESLLAGLSGLYHTSDSADMENWGTGLSDILSGEPLLAVTGSGKR